jgi:hypothetical protein
MISEKEIKMNPMFWFLAVLSISATVGLQAWLTLFNNFAVDVAGLDGNHIGVIQSLREVPGFLALLAVYDSHFGPGSGPNRPVSLLSRAHFDHPRFELWPPLLRNHQHVAHPAIF